MSEKEPTVPEENESNSAKVLRLHGDDRAEELEEARIEAEKDIKRVSWIENFWYHHKWAVIMIGIFVLIAGIAIFQLIERDSPDAVVMIAGGDYVGDSGVRILKPIFEDNLKGEEDTAKSTVSVYYVVYVPGDANASMAMQQFTSEFSAGDCSLFLLSPELYEIAKETGLLLPLSEIFPDGVPDFASDDTSLRLGDCPIYRENANLSFLSADLRLCVRSVPMLVQVRDKSSAEARVEAAKKILIAWAEKTS